MMMMANTASHIRRAAKFSATFATRFSVAAALSLVLAGCSYDDYPMTVKQIEHDYRVRHPLTVKSGTAVTWVSFSGDTAVLGGRDVAKLGRYFASYIEAGHGVIKASVSGQNITTSTAADRVRALKAIAAQEGIKDSEIQISIVPELPASDGLAAAKLGYMRYVVNVPPCPDWSKDRSASGINTDHTNFGCATQANFGAMIVDPADLFRMRTMAPSDAEIGDSAIRVLRAPTSTTSGSAATLTTSTGTSTGTTN